MRQKRIRIMEYKRLDHNSELRHSRNYIMFGIIAVIGIILYAINILS